MLAAGVLWATSGPFSILLYRRGVPPASVALLRPAVGGLVLGLLLVVFARHRLQAGRRSVLFMLVGGGVIVGIFQLAYQMSTASIGVPATVALLYLSPAFVLVASTVLLGEELTRAKGVLGGISVLGVWLTVLGARGIDVNLTTTGVIWGALCGLTYGCYTLFGKAMSPDHGPLAPLFWSTAGGTGFLALLQWASSESIILPPDSETWLILILFGSLTIAASALLLFNALRTLDAGRAVIGTTIEPLVATLLAIALLDQVLTSTGWIGLTLLLVGVIGAYSLRPGEAEPG